MILQALDSREQVGFWLSNQSTCREGRIAGRVAVHRRYAISCTFVWMSLHMCSMSLEPCERQVASPFSCFATGHWLESWASGGVHHQAEQGKSPRSDSRARDVTGSLISLVQARSFLHMVTRPSSSKMSPFQTDALAPNLRCLGVLIGNL